MKKVKIKLPRNDNEVVRPFIFDLYWVEDGCNRTYRLYGFKELFMYLKGGLL
jgi:hypothetical protein